MAPGAAQEVVLGGGGVTKAEKETVIRWDEEERMVSVYSCSASVWRFFERKGRRATSVQHDLAGKVISREYLVPLPEFRWGLKSEARTRQGKARAALTRPKAS